MNSKEKALLQRLQNHVVQLADTIGDRNIFHPTVLQVTASYITHGPRGRIVYDRARDLFIIYADRKLLTPATIARIATQFHLPAERTEIQSDLHYQSTETPNVL